MKTLNCWKKERYSKNDPWQIRDGVKVLAKITDTVHDDYATKVANLVVAAPELLEALKGLNRENNGEYCFCDKAIGHPLMSKHSDACLKAQAAISKAQGEE